MGLFMSQGKPSVVITPGDSPIGYSILLFVLSVLAIPFLIGIVLVPFTGLYFLYQVIHCYNHWIRVTQSKIDIHYLLYTVTIPKNEFIRATLKETGVGKLSVLTLHTISGKYHFGLVDNPKYAEDVFFEFKNKTQYYDYETERHTYTQSTYSSSQKQTDYSRDSEHSREDILTKNERKGKELEDAVFSFISSPGNIPGYHRELRNVYVQRPDGSTTEIDLIMIHDAGIYVFECKNHAGNIYGSVGNNTWAVFYPGGEKHNPPNPIRQNAGHINALSDYLKMQRSCFYSCVVLGREACLKKVPEDDSHCFISKYQNLERKLMNQIYHSSVRLSADDIGTIYACLEPLTKVSEEVKEKHKRDIREKYGDF